MDGDMAQLALLIKQVRGDQAGLVDAESMASRGMLTCFCCSCAGVICRQ